MNGDTRIAVDIGGTFTDVVLEHDGQRRSTKVLTTSVAPEEGVLEGVQAMLAASGVAAKDVRLVIHGTKIGRAHV